LLVHETALFEALDGDIVGEKVVWAMFTVRED
jgi:hypothetical protein